MQNEPSLDSGAAHAPFTDTVHARRVALVLAGGIGLGAYHGGAYEALHAQAALRPDWIAASSVGAVNAAIIAGNAPEARVERLRALWTTADPWLAIASSAERGAPYPWRHLQNWASVLHGRLLGAGGHFRPRYVPRPFQNFASFYDLAPMRARFEALIDFGRLNSGETRLSVATTDVASGETVVFDTARGDRIGPEHLLASCGYLPEFAPVEIDGRLLGDGGLSVNAPIEAVLFDDRFDGERVCVVVDLFARDGERPTGLEAALERKNDLLLGNQTYKRLEAFSRELALCEALAGATRSEPSADAQRLLERRSRIRAFVHLSYRAARHEAGPEKMFDLSRATMRDRWDAGALDMDEAIRRIAALPAAIEGCVLTSVRR